MCLHPDIEMHCLQGKVKADAEQACDSQKKAVRLCQAEAEYTDPSIHPCPQAPKALIESIILYQNTTQRER
jgi:hypothetical protein